MTISRPSRGSTANWMLQPPVSTPTSRGWRCQERIFWYSRSVRVIAGATVTGVAGVHAHRVEVLDRADDDDVVVAVAHQLELVFLPAVDRLLDEHVGDGEAARPRRPSARRPPGLRHPRPEAAHGERRADDDRQPEFGDRLADLLHGEDAGGGPIPADRATMS